MQAQGPSAGELLHRFRADVRALLQQVCPLLGTLQTLSESQAHNRIYQIYSGPTTANQYDAARDRIVLIKFLRIIQGIRNECGKTIVIQGYGRALSVDDLVQFMFQGIGTGDNFRPACELLCTQLEIPVPQTVHGMLDLLETDLWSNFFHFLSGRFNPATITKRIYIHCSSVANSLRVLRNCCGLLDHPSCQGLMEMKIAGPGCGGRLDTIVVYLADDSAVKSFLFLMQHLPIPPDCFAAGVPMGIKEVKPGVGVADEPPNVGLIQPISFENVSAEDRLENQEAQSFGSFLAKLIVIAMEGTQNETEFLSNLIELFKLAGIDPADPHIHAGRQRLEELHKHGQSAQWGRKEKK